MEQRMDEGPTVYFTRVARYRTPAYRRAGRV